MRQPPRGRSGRPGTRLHGYGTPRVRRHRRSADGTIITPSVADHRETSAVPAAPRAAPSSTRSSRLTGGRSAAAGRHPAEISEFQWDRAQRPGSLPTPTRAGPAGRDRGRTLPSSMPRDRRRTLGPARAATRGIRPHRPAGRDQAVAPRRNTRRMPALRSGPCLDASGPAQDTPAATPEGGRRGRHDDRREARAGSSTRPSLAPRGARPWLQ